MMQVAGTVSEFSDDAWELAEGTARCDSVITYQGQELRCQRPSGHEGTHSY